MLNLRLESITRSSSPLFGEHSLWGAADRGLGRRAVFVPAVIGGEGPSRVRVPITSSSSRCRKEEGAGEEENEQRRTESFHFQTLIRQRGRPLSEYRESGPHRGGGSVQHTGKVIETTGVSLGRTNHCFTRLDGDVLQRRGPGQEQSPSPASSSEDR